MTVGDREVDLREAVEQGAAEQQRWHKHNQLRLEKMRVYAELRGRREYLLLHFGEEAAARCGNCDNCEAAGSRRGEARPQSRVVHKEWGQRIIEERERGRGTALFDDAGRKTLSLDAVRAKGLLEPAA